MPTTEQMEIDSLSQLSTSIEQNLSWIPCIYLKSTHFCHPSSECETTNTICINREPSQSHSVNLSLFLDESIYESPALSIFRSSVLNYPANAVLEIENLKGLDDEEHVIQLLKDAAADSGTVLVIESVRKSRSNQRQKELMFVCDHYRLSRGKKKQFEEGKHQLPGSKVQQEHNKGKKNNNDDTGVTLTGDNSNTGNCNHTVRKVTSVRPECLEDQCCYSFTVFCSAMPETEGKWYIAKTRRNSKNQKFKHTNHLPVSKIHLSTSLSNLSNDIKRDIRLKIRSGCSPTAIAAEIRERYKKTISIQQIYHMMQGIVDELITRAGENPSYSAAERLLQVFKTYDNVSYVYVKHHIQTGFVRYTKSHSCLQEVAVNVIDATSQATTSDEIDLWRKELQLGHNNDILVSFAWSHTEESRKLCMFPQFVGVDLTFGVHRQKRPLLVMTGIDGYNKSFTAFRCFMPSKTKQAYKWALHVALPFLVGQPTVDQIQCISTDNEEALIQAIDESKNLSDGLARTVHHRLDFYHLFIQVWNHKCVAPNNASSNVLEAINTIKDWVYSWVTEVETEAEFRHSLLKYEAYFNDVKESLGDHLTKEIEAAVGRVISNIDRVGSHNFQRVATMGFIGSSIVEGTNVGIKRGTHAAKATMNIDLAGSQMLRQVDEHSYKRNIEIAQGIHRHKTWSSSLTKDILTAYMEGLAVKNFDRRHEYYCTKESDQCWYVVNKNTIAELTEQRLPTSPKVVIPRYRHVRTVRLDDEGFMKCTCSYSYQYLSPCRHMMAVLDQSENVLPDLFHIRWWDVFNYYYLTEFGQSTVPQLHKSIEKAYLGVIEAHFSSDMSYKGPYIRNRCTIIGPPAPAENIVHYIHVMYEYINHRNGVLEKGGDRFRQYLSEHDTYLDSEQPEFDCGQSTNGDINPVPGLSGVGETVAMLSPKRLHPGSANIPNTSYVKPQDTEDYHLFMSTKDAAKTTLQRSKLRCVLSQLRNEFLSENRHSKIQDCETTFLGEDGSSGHRSGKRHKQLHERWSKRK